MILSNTLYQVPFLNIGANLLNVWDFIVIAFYLIFTLSIGYICKAVAKNGSDFFRGGGNMLWWMTGMSGVASGLSAWTFTAAASRTYDMGFFMVIQFWLWIPAYLLLYFFLANRFRQMRIITVCDAIRQRFGVVSEQFWVWICVPVNLLVGCVWLLTVSIFMNAALNIPTAVCIVALGAIVCVISLGAGAWSVIASDFIQMTIIFISAVAVFVSTLLLPEVGGVSGFAEKIPEKFTNFNLTEATTIWVFFLGVQGLMRLMQVTDLSKEGAKFFSAKNGKEAKKATLILIFGFMIIPLIAFVPVMASSWVVGDLNEVIPGLKNPKQGAYMAIAAAALPQGMVGLIVCAIFAASISSMDTALNRNAGFFVKNFWQVYVNQNMEEKSVIKVARICTVIFGIAMVCIGLFFNHLLQQDPDTGIFEFSNTIFSLFIPPMLIPTVYGIIYKKTPAWSGWSSALVCFIVAFLAKFGIERGWFGFDFEWLAIHWFGAENPITMEVKDVQFIVTILLIVIIGSVWFFGSALWYNKSTQEHKDSVNNLFINMNTPIEDNPEVTPQSDALQYKIVGSLCLVFGISLTCGVLIPNDIQGRLTFIACGGAITLVGWLLYRNFVRLNKQG